MKEMGWSWTQYLEAPLYLVEFVVEQVKARQEEQESARRKAALKGKKL